MEGLQDRPAAFVAAAVDHRYTDHPPLGATVHRHALHNAWAVHPDAVVVDSYSDRVAVDRTADDTDTERTDGTVADWDVRLDAGRDGRHIVANSMVNGVDRQLHQKHRTVDDRACLDVPTFLKKKMYVKKDK